VKQLETGKNDTRNRKSPAKVRSRAVKSTASAEVAALTTA